MPNYLNGKIYLIEGNGLTYYGSSVQSLREILNRHERHQNTTYSVKQIIELGNYTIKLVELFPCKTKAELLWRERWWIENHECVNMHIPIITIEEKLLRKKETDKIRHANLAHTEKEKIRIIKYMELNRDRILAKQKEYNKKRKLAKL